MPQRGLGHGLRGSQGFCNDSTKNLALQIVTGAGGGGTKMSQIL